MDELALHRQKAQRKVDMQVNLDRIAALATTPELPHLSEFYSKMLIREAITPEMRITIGEYYGIDAKEVAKRFRTYYHDAKIYEAIGDTPKNEYEFINAMMNKWQATMTYDKIFTLTLPLMLDGVEITEEEYNSTCKDTQDTIMLYNPKVFTYLGMCEKLYKVRAELTLPFNDTQIQHALTYWTKAKCVDLKGTMCSDIKYDIYAEKTAQWDELAKGITKIEPQLAKVALQHFIWQVKRKLREMPVFDHLMPIFYGRTKEGKTTLMNMFTAPLKELAAPTTFTDICDNRNIDLWDNYILMLDDFNDSFKNNLEAIKSTCTADKLTRRPMRTNTSSIVYNRATWIGTSNKHINQVIHDSTGMRRFYEIECSIDRAVVNSIDFGKLWRSIDESKASPFKPEDYDAVQETYRLITPIEDFLSQRHFIDGEKIKAADLYDEYRVFEISKHPRQNTSQTRFGRDVVSAAEMIDGLDVIKHTTRTHSYYQFWTTTHNNPPQTYRPITSE